MSVLTALYRLFGADDALLYVGISNVFGRRWHQHSKDKDWWTEVRYATLEWHQDRNLALAAEEAAIKAEHPQYNIVHNMPSVPGALAEEEMVTGAPYGDLLEKWLLREPMMDADDAAAFLGVTKKELAAWRRAGTHLRWYELSRGNPRYDPFDLRTYRDQVKAAA